VAFLPANPCFPFQSQPTASSFSNHKSTISLIQPTILAETIIITQISHSNQPVATIVLTQSKPQPFQNCQSPNLKPMLLFISQKLTSPTSIRHLQIKENKPKSATHFNINHHHWIPKLPPLQRIEEE
jgi:hypothetical protein